MSSAPHSKSLSRDGALITLIAAEANSFDDCSDWANSILSRKTVFCLLLHVLSGGCIVLGLSVHSVQWNKFVRSHLVKRDTWES